MDIPRDLILRDVRCFQGTQRGRLRPITLLVGENSTGKTTFLGCYSVLHQMFARPDIEGRLDFNEQPFTMGSFRDIVRSRRGPGGRIEEFTIGLIAERAPRRGIPSHKLLATFREEGSQPVLSSFRFDFDVDSFLELQWSSDGTVIQIPDHQVETSIRFREALFVLDMLVNSRPRRQGKVVSAPATGGSSSSPGSGGAREPLHRGVQEARTPFRDRNAQRLHCRPRPHFGQKAETENRRRLHSLFRAYRQRREDPQHDAGRTRQPAGCAGGVP